MVSMTRFRQPIFRFIGTILCLFTLAEVNYPNLTPQSQLAFFAMFGLALIFLKFPIHKRFETAKWARILDWVLLAVVFFIFGFIVVQNEPVFKGLWINGTSLGNRAAQEVPLDYAVGLVGLFLVLEATRRSIGVMLPLLSLGFIAYAAFGNTLPNWLFPHRGFDWTRIVSQTFLHSQGVFGIALNVMFTYVFLFVIFGALLEKTGATHFIIQFARRMFRRSAGGPAKVAVISSGMMGSLSGSAVANTATTGTFTIPMMRSVGFSNRVASGVEAAASSGGALVPPVMGAGAYMMLEIIEPQVTYLEIVKAALIPAVLYYVSLLLIVHFFAKKVGAGSESPETGLPEAPDRWPGVIFFSAFLVLILLLVYGFSPFRAVSVTLVVIYVLSLFNKKTRMSFGDVKEAMVKSSGSGVALVAAASCVGIVIGVVTLTGVGSKLPSAILPLAQQNLVLGLILLMIATIILGMGLPSAVCYLLMATLIGPTLGDLGVVPIAAHLFIFYFGMMSMVTPPVALAAYTAATIAGADIMKAGFAAFRFALVGFALPFAFVLQPELLMLNPDGTPAAFGVVFLAVVITLLGIVALAAGISGFWFARLPPWQRGLLLVFSVYLLLVPNPSTWLVSLVGLGLGGVGFLSWSQRSKLNP